MVSYPEDFNKLHFTESNLGTPIVLANEVRIPVSGLFVLHGHPLLSKGDGPYSGWLVFTAVTHSTRTVTEYIGGPMASGGFKEPIHHEDGPFLNTENNDRKEYSFEGLQQDPSAWIDNWIINAASFQLLVD
jgi:hypothetical protein